MTRRGGAGPRLARLFVAVAARIVDARRRSEWRREWEAELWVASERGRPVLRHALGAFRHAFSVRRHGSFDASAASVRMFEHIRFSWLDVKLGLRMLTKYPVLSSVSVIGMSVAIAIGAIAFSIVASVMDTTLPLPEGDRMVALRNAVVTAPGDTRTSLRDFTTWRDELESVRDLAAFTTTGRTLVVPGAGVAPVRVARMAASGFGLARTAPVLGRPLLEEDERSGARVVVIAFEEWRRRFAADPEIIGRRVRLGSEMYTVVGVMPEGFRFPVDDRYWIPFAVGAAEREPSISVTIVGRLADGATLERARAEIGAIGARMAAAYPETHERLRPEVLPYTRAFIGVSEGEGSDFHLLRLLVSLLLVVVAVNVAILVYARTATRLGEISVRTALGASRARVVTQLFAEALVLSGTAAAVALAIAGIVLARLRVIAEHRFDGLPFWVELGLSPGVVTYALVLAVLGAAIVGVAPALKATGRSVRASLQRLSERGGHMRLGGAWTVLIITQVAVAVAVLPFAMHLTQEAIAGATFDAGYPAEEFLEASLAMERAGPPRDTGAGRRTLERRFTARAAELIRRLEGEPAVAGVTIRIPGSRERFEIEDIASPSPGADQRTLAAGTERIDRVEADFFALHDMPILAGRTFTEADARAGATAVIVNQVFAADHIGNGAVPGRRLRFVREADDAGEVVAGPWLEIVGVVRDFQAGRYEPSDNIYLPADVGRLSPPISLVIRVRVDPAISFAPRLREIAAAVDPALQLEGLVSAAERHRQWRQFARYVAIGATAVMLSVLLLSAAGIYAMMSFTVARRRREIAIRSALGAAPRRVLSGVFARASAQISAGVLFGVIGTFALDRVAGRGPVHDGNVVVLLFVAVLMATVGLLAAIGPARRGLAVQPTEALREE